jgi:hypothetical protein
MLIFSDIDFRQRCKITDTFGVRCKIADTFLPEGTKLQTPFLPKVQNCRHLFAQKYQITDIFFAEGAKSQTPFLFTTRFFGLQGTKLQTPLAWKTTAAA